MCTRVEEVQGALAAIVAALDPDAVPLPDAPGLWERFDAVERLAGAAKTLLARRVEESRAWLREGYRSAAEYLAAKGGESVGGARRELDTSHKLPSAPGTEQALRRGRLSGPKAESIADAAAANPGAEGRLLENAEAMSLTEVKDACAKAKAAADPDPDATYRRIHESRRLRQFGDGEGAWNLAARGTPDAGAVVNAAIDPIIDELFKKARAEGRREPREAYAFDALIELARRATGADSEQDTKRRRTNPTFLGLLRVDAEALINGAVEGDQLCEITGLGPIPVARARELLGDAVLKLVITRGVDVANVTHLGRGPTAAQRIALLWTSPTCTVEACNGVRVQIDHRVPWTETHHTRLDESDPLCPHHHHQKTHEGWALVEGKGKRPMVPPEDPRHPRNARNRGSPERSPPEVDEDAA